MSRKARRGLQKLLGGRRAAQREGRLRELESEIASLRQRLADVDERTRPFPGAHPGERPASVTVGGREVAIRPLNGEAWAAALEELPGFLLTYAAQKRAGEATGEDLEAMRQRAMRWIDASAVESVDTEQLSVPEAGVAITKISALNGFDAHLAEFFRERLPPPTPRPGRETVRGEAERAAPGTN